MVNRQWTYGTAEAAAEARKIRERAMSAYSVVRNYKMFLWEVYDGENLIASFLRREDAGKFASWSEHGSPKPAPDPASRYEIEEYGGVFRVLRDGEYLGTRATREAAFKWIEAEEGCEIHRDPAESAAASRYSLMEDGSGLTYVLRDGVKCGAYTARQAAQHWIDDEVRHEAAAAKPKTLEERVAAIEKRLDQQVIPVAEYLGR